MAELNNIVLEIIRVLILGITQGVSVLVPVSSQVRFDFVHKITGVDLSASGNPLVMFFLQLGVLLAIIFIFRSRVMSLIRATGRITVKLCKRKFIWSEARTSQKILVFIIFSYIPVFILMPFLSVIFSLEKLWWLTGSLFIISAFVYLFSDRVVDNDRKDDKMNVKDAVFAGVANLFGFLPGVSCVGMTAAACSYRGFRKNFCIKYAFLIFIPAVLISVINFLAQGIITQAYTTEIVYGFFGMFVTFGTTIVVIKIMRYLMEQRKMYLYAAVSAAIGTALIVINVFI